MAQLNLCENCEKYVGNGECTCDKGPFPKITRTKLPFGKEDRSHVTLPNPEATWNHTHSEKAWNCSTKEKKAEETGTPIDAVNHPNHYMHEGIETIDVIRAWTRHLDGYTGFLLGNAIKYISRWSDKGGVEDLKKAKWYLDEAIKEGKKNG